MTKSLLLLSFMLVSIVAFTQNHTVKGKITDITGSSLPGVSIQVVGTSLGTTTDIDGTYSINAPQNATIRYSYIGYEPQEILIKSISTINIILLEKISSLEEVVVVGYGTQKKKDLTTAVSVVGEKEMKNRPLVSAAQALQGKAAGVQVTQTSGKPGAGIAVRVRGATSVLAGNEPLYVVDGIPTDNISNLNANDVESMSILKDASSSAIYGARAANGVVMITTKRGKTNASTLNFNTFFGASQLRKPIEVLNTKQYRSLIRDLGFAYDPTWTNYTNWNDEVFGTGYTQSYQLSSSGGSEKSTYFVSAGYLSEKGIVKPAKFDRYSVRINLDNKVLDWLKLGTNFNITHLNSKDTPDNLSSGRGGVIMSTLNTPPFLQIYKDDGSGWFDPNPIQNSWENPIAYMQGANQTGKTNRLAGSFNLEATINPNLTAKARFGVDIDNYEYDYYLDPFRTTWGRKNHGVGESQNNNSLTWLYENTLDYSKVIGKHALTALAGSNIQRNEWSGSYLYGTNFPNDVNVTTLNAANTITGNSTASEWSLASFFGRFTYNFDNKYYLTATFREDGSSKLSHPWGSMPSFSAGWRISSEKFMQDFSFIDDLKLRGGWGKNGNQEGISPYAQYGLIEYSRYTLQPNEDLGGPASYQSSYSNPDLKWETTKQTNIGFDLTMLNSRLTLNFDMYWKYTSDVLMNVQLPAYLPISYIQTNVGEISNRGIEFNVSTVNIDRKLKWNTDFNISFNKNKVEALKYTPVYYFGNTYSNNSNVSIVKAGLPIGSFYGYIAEGVDPETGNMIYKDISGNGSIGAEDRTQIGCAQPDFTLGFTNRFSYKRFDLNLFIQGSYGNEIYNATRIDLEGMFDSKNQSVSVLRRWTPNNTITDIPKAGNMYNVQTSSRFIEDGSYLRLKSVTFSYNVLKNNQIKAIKNLSVYITGQNLITLTQYSGYDPEVSSKGNNAAEMGIDYGTYPQYRTIMAGLNVEF